ncbi:MAG: dCMP deaminase [Candidatus Methanofastidiosa archaeon]|nr:dCMP deaminase [Candidatus Methanofastidiosa archaeon]
MKQNHDLYVKMVFILAEESKCVSHQVAALIVKEGRIISTGINGTPSGLPNCCEIFDKDNFDREEHHKWSKDNEVHAEMNAVAFAAKYDIGVEGCDMYVTISPCNDCLKNLIPAGIKNIYYLYLYDKVTLNPTLLQKINVQEVPNAEHLKKWVEKHGLVPKQYRK